MLKRTLNLCMLIVSLAAVAATPVGAVRPTTDVIPIDFSFVPPVLSSNCGFAVTRHVQGTLTVRTFLHSSGTFSRELDQFHLVETLMANGRSLVGRTTQNVTTALFDDGSYTVAFVGSDFRLPVPGAGISFGSVGRFVLEFAADNTLIGVLQDVGNTASDYAAICAALA